MYISWYDSIGVCCASSGAPTVRQPGEAAGLPASIAAPRSLWRLNQVWLMLNKGSADKWNSQRAVMLTSLSSSSPYNCLSMSQQDSPEVAAAPLATSPVLHKRLGRKKVSFIFRASTESQLVEMFFFSRFVFLVSDCYIYSIKQVSLNSSLKCWALTLHGLRPLFWHLCWTTTVDVKLKKICHKHNF